MPPRLEWGGHLAPIRRGTERGKERLIGTQQAILGRNGRHEPDRPPERRGTRADLGHAHRIGARPDLAEVLLVHAGCHLVQVRLNGRQVRTDEHRGRRIEITRRAVGFDGLDMQCRPAVLHLERGLDAAGFLARKRPAHELAEELRETWPGHPVAGPATGRVRGPGDASTEAVLPLRQERIVPGGDENGLGRRLRGRAVVPEKLREAVVQASKDRG